ncbi:hypothetical protein CASFOL_039908 [Castilleja foliolosa]|uniref:DUF7792 domain-containing protein n=1 Tax=Castilleja foliolosa TaxID=1961234 RepID=A0ABD3BH27_9LAMI
MEYNKQCSMYNIPCRRLFLRRTIIKCFQFQKHLLTPNPNPPETLIRKHHSYFKLEFSEVGKQGDRLRQMLSSAPRLASSSTLASPFYDRALCRIAAEVSRTLEKSLTLAKKCRRRVVIIVSKNDFLKLPGLLDSSVTDMRCNCFTICFRFLMCKLL